MARIKPSNGFLKLNVKAVFDRQIRKAAVGCVRMDHNGAWTKGCAGMIGLAPTFCAELWALFYGLKTAWKRDDGVEKRLIVKVDSAQVAQAVLNPDPNAPMADLVQWIDNLLHEKWKVLELLLIDESASKAAKALAVHSLDGRGGVGDLNEPPAVINEVLANDV